MEGIFFWYGKTIAHHPWIFILLTFLVTGLSGLGMMKLRMENNGIKLWIPHDSSQRVNTDWLWDNHPPESRFSSMIFVGDNVLDPNVIRSMYALHQRIDAIVTDQGLTWKDLCMKAPVVKPPSFFDLFGKRRKRRQTTSEETDDSFFEEDDFFTNIEEESDPFELNQDDTVDTGELFSVSMYPDPYCDIMENMEEACLEMSILELWANEGHFDDDTDRAMQELTLEQVLDKINGQNKSGVFLVEKNFTQFLSNVKRDENGRIIGAEATIIRWLGKMNTTSAKLNPVKGRGEPIDADTLEFEGMMIEAMLNTSDYPEGLVSYPNVKRSFGDIAGSTILGDVGVMAIGYMIVFVYVSLMLGKFNALEQRSTLAVTGFLGVIMGIIVSYGLCSAFGLFFGPMHSVLPFLLLGIGIDDMFVIVQSWDTLEAARQKQNDLSLAERMGEALSQSGVAITITSVTDIIAFAIGGTTILPALSSFCIYASVGIVAIYFFQCTFFVACMSLDIRRLEANRNSCCPYIKHDKEWRTNECSQGEFIRKGFSFYGKMLTKVPVKVTVLTVTLVTLGFGIYGNVLLRQEFDPAWFLPPDTYLGN